MFDFSFLTKSIQKIQEQHRALTVEYQQIQSDIASEKNARTNRKDVLATVGPWVKESASKFAPAMQDRLLNHFNLGEIPPYKAGFLGVVRHESGDVGIGQMDSALCALFGDQIEKLLVESIEQMPWPEEGLPRAERTAKIDKLTARAKDVQGQIQALQKSAEEAGIEL